MNERIKRVKMLILDVDGVLTNGQIFFGNEGELFKQFNVQDGMGISLFRQAGHKVAVITGRTSDIVRLRSAELKIDDVYQGSMSKKAALADLLAKHDLKAEEVCYIGDDLIDIPVMNRVGLPCAVANAVAEVKSAAVYVSEKEGGRGAVREIVEMILKAQDRFEMLVAKYRDDAPEGTAQ